MREDNRAERALMALLDRRATRGSDRWRALRALLQKHLGEGDRAAAREILDRLVRQHARMRSDAGGRAMLIAQAALLLGDREVAARASATLPAAAAVEGSFLALFAAGDPEARSEALRQGFTAAGLAAVATAADTALAPFDGLTGGPAPAVVPERGETVTVVVPVHNAGATLGTALRSLLAQTWRDLDIVVVDDASTDATADLAEDWAARDGRIRVLRHASNRGAYASRNSGLAAAVGTVVTVHDGDDWSHPQKIGVQMSEFAARPGAVALGCHWLRTTPGFGIGTDRPTETLFARWYAAALIRRSLFDATGPWDAVRIDADLEFLERLAGWYGRERIHWCRSGVPLGFGRVAPTSLTQARETHRRTGYQGLRFYYRQAARHWRRLHPAPEPEAHKTKYRWLPEEMFTSGVPVRSADLHLVGDCTDPRVIAEMARLAHDTPGPIAVSHRPAFNPAQRVDFDLDPAFFDLVGRDDVFIAIAPDRVSAPQTLDFEADG